MPFQSKSQERLFWVKEKKGELPKGTAQKWADHTPNIKDLPEHVKHAVFGKIAIALKKLKKAAQAKDCPCSKEKTYLSLRKK